MTNAESDLLPEPGTNVDEKKVEDSLKPEVQKDEKSQWDKERQKGQQEAANYRKLAKQYEETVSQQNEYLEGLQNQITNLTAQISALGKKSETDNLGELDPALVDGGVIKHIDSLRGKLGTLEKKYGEAERKISLYEQQETAKLEDARKSNVIEKILKPLDGEFGAKYRQQAIKLADELINEGEEQQPQDALDADRLMRQCYKKVKEQTETKKAASAVVDSGSGKSVASEKTAPKTGKLSEVWEQMKKEGKFKL